MFAPRDDGDTQSHTSFSELTIPHVHEQVHQWAAMFPKIRWSDSMNRVQPDPGLAPADSIILVMLVMLDCLVLDWLQGSPIAKVPAHHDF